MDKRLTAILALQRRLDRWRRGWHKQHREQEIKAKAKEKRSHAEISKCRPGKGYHLPL